MNGRRLLQILIEATGLPQESVEQELVQILARRGVSPENVTLDDLREVLANYMQDTLIEMKQSGKA